MKIVSWNVNGLKSAINRGFKEFIKENEFDIVCIQETKITHEIKEINIEGYYKYFNYSAKGRIFWGGNLFKTKSRKCINWN